MSPRDTSRHHRRFRVDASRAPRGPAVAGRSGRRFVVVAVLLFLLTWLGLWLGFRSWRAANRARAEFGRRVVVPAVYPLTAATPEGIEPEAWADAVARTHDLVAAHVGTGLVGYDAMRALRAELLALAEDVRAHPERARGELAALWRRLRARGGPALDRYPPPKLLDGADEPGAGPRRPG